MANTTPIALLTQAGKRSVRQARMISKDISPADPLARTLIVTLQATAAEVADWNRASELAWAHTLWCLAGECLRSGDRAGAIVMGDASERIRNRYFDHMGFKR